MIHFLRGAALALALAGPAIAAEPVTSKAAAAAKALTGTWELVRYETPPPTAP